MTFIKNYQISVWKPLIKGCLILVLTFGIITGYWGNTVAWGSIDDDRLDGNIFVVYAGNGSLVPAKLSLKESLKRQMPTVLVFYLDDSRDCKAFALIVSRIQEFYGRAANILPVSVDSIFPKDQYSPQEPGFYYRGVVPQTVVIDQQGKVVFDGQGQVEYQVADDVLRKVFDLLPRTESVELKRRTFNEFNTELVEQ